MPGPAPKDPSLRARANKSTTRAVLNSDHNIKAPPLPAEVEWHPLTKRWWRDIWKSPMATEYVAMDINGLYRVAMLYNDFWTAKDAKARAEVQVRLEKADAEYGTNPLARRRLEWQIEETEGKRAQGERRRAAQSSPSEQPSAGDDPRLKLVDKPA